MPGPLGDAELRNFVRNATITVWHQAGTAKMGHDSLSVVDSQLKVYGVENLRVADASIMPRITTGNIMAPASSLAKEQGKCSDRIITFDAIPGFRGNGYRSSWISPVG